MKRRLSNRWLMRLEASAVLSADPRDTTWDGRRDSFLLLALAARTCSPNESCEMVSAHRHRFGLMPRLGGRGDMKPVGSREVGNPLELRTEIASRSVSSYAR